MYTDIKSLFSTTTSVLSILNSIDTILTMTYKLLQFKLDVEKIVDNAKEVITAITADRKKLNSNLEKIQNLA